MLMNTVEQNCENDVCGAGVRPIVATPGMRQAANTGGFDHSEMQARRQRRSRRAENAARNGGTGWRVRAW